MNENEPNLDYHLRRPIEPDQDKTTEKQAGSFAVLGSSLYPDADMSHDLPVATEQDDRIQVSHLPNMDYN